MDKTFISDLRALVDHLAARNVAFLSVSQAQTRLELQIRPSCQVATEQVPHRDEVRAIGPGIFRAAHPDSGLCLPLIEAGDFLFPVTETLGCADLALVPDGAVVGYGTAILRERTAG